MCTCTVFDSPLSFVFDFCDQEPFSFHIGGGLLKGGGGIAAKLPASHMAVYKRANGCISGLCLGVALSH